MCYTIYLLLLIKKIRTSATQRPAPASNTTLSRRDWVDRSDKPDYGLLARSLQGCTGKSDVSGVVVDQNVNEIEMTNRDNGIQECI